MRGMLPWVALILTICFNAAASLLLKLSTGLPTSAQLLAAGGSVGCFGLAFVSYYASLRSFPVSVAYPVITGGGIVTIVLVAAPLLGESLTNGKALGAVLVIFGGVLLLRNS